MPVVQAKSELGALLEEVLDKQEDYIGVKVFDDLEAVYEELDREALEMEEGLEELEGVVAQLEERVAELEQELGL